jgi:outer membrane murein-binding lipoprotein Lpp
MSRSPAQLAAAAMAVRAIARATTADFVGLAPHSGRATWEGPAATDHRRRVGAAVGDAHDLAAELDRLADRLDAQAAALLAADEAASRRREERLTAPAPVGEGRADG